MTSKRRRAREGRERSEGEEERSTKSSGEAIGRAPGFNLRKKNSLKFLNDDNGSLSVRKVAE